MHKYYRKKWICWKCVARKVGFFSFRAIAPKQFRLTTIDSLSGLGDAEVTYPLWVQEHQGSIPGSGQGF